MPTIAHLDADAFFVAVEQALNPALRGKKVAVGGRERGIIASASYEARACGVHTPMPTSQALRLCPELILVSHANGMARYVEYSRKLFDLCETLTPIVERRSIDEGYMDLAPCGLATAPALTMAIRELQARIQRTLGISVSFGLASNKLTAAIASKQHKPHGLTLVPPGNESAYLAAFPIGTLPGIGKKTENLLKSNGITRIRDLANHASPAQLQSLLGSHWHDFVAMARGEDTTAVLTEHEDAKSYSQQETFPRDTADSARILRTAKGMLDALMPKIRADGKRARTLTLKVRYPGMDNATATHSLPEATDLEAPFYPHIGTLLRTAWRRARTPLRLVAIRLSGIENAAATSTQPRQLELFSEKATPPRPGDKPARQSARQRQLAAVVDAINARHGPSSLRHGHQL
ncbi:MAG: DNA polymerase IV [Puniceicoccales bacterium]|nr:DNA polymerase IV [Puniceicoccales bacterium]